MRPSMTHYLTKSLALLGLALATSAWAAPDAKLIKQGEYLARAGDCFACHSVTGWKPFAGVLGMVKPFVMIYSSNITPDKNAGFGNCFFEDLDKLMLTGVS